LTRADQDQIKQLYAAGAVEQRQLAKQFGVSQTTIWRIISGGYYSSVDGEFENVANTSESSLSCRARTPLSLPNFTYTLS